MHWPPAHWAIAGKADPLQFFTKRLAFDICAPKAVVEVECASKHSGSDHGGGET